MNRSTTGEVSSTATETLFEEILRAPADQIESAMDNSKGTRFWRPKYAADQHFIMFVFTHLFHRVLLGVYDLYFRMSTRPVIVMGKHREETYRPLQVYCYFLRMARTQLVLTTVEDLLDQKSELATAEAQRFLFVIVLRLQAMHDL